MLSLEGCVEWQHHRHLVREAESGLRSEIEQNSKMLTSIRRQIQDEQKLLDENLLVLSHMRVRPGTPVNRWGSHSACAVLTR